MIPIIIQEGHIRSTRGGLTNFTTMKMNSRAIDREREYENKRKRRKVKYLQESWERDKNFILMNRPMRDPSDEVWLGEEMTLSVEPMKIFFIFSLLSLAFFFLFFKEKTRNIFKYFLYHFPLYFLPLIFHVIQNLRT